MDQVLELWRYPVKSMGGERLDGSLVTERGLVGDRAFALVDVESGKIASAKSPRRWPNLLDFHAAFVEPPRPDGPLPPVRITLPDGRHVNTDDPDVEELLSEATGRQVRFVSTNPQGAVYEYYVPDIEGVDPRGMDFYTEFPNDPFGTGSLHDVAPVHVLTTATLTRLQHLYPAGRFDVRRFRPNVVVASDDGGFVENDWVKKELTIGEVEVRITMPMNRCVMTTLPQGDLPRDKGILRTAALHNRQQVLRMGEFACVGVGGLVQRPGTVRRDDRVVVNNNFHRP